MDEFSVEQKRWHIKQKLDQILINVKNNKINFPKLQGKIVITSHQKFYPCIALIIILVNVWGVG